MAKKPRRFESRKDVWKFLRSIIEAGILLFLLIMIMRALFVSTTYEPYGPEAAATSDNGFIVVSYYGAKRSGDNLSISAEQLENQLKALYDSGYVTITQQDVIEYYQGKKLLPAKALLLLFEDGTRGTAIFAEKIMAAYNYKATMLTYADYFFQKDTNLLDPKDLHELADNTYWEVGTSGCKLAYINVFDRNGVYLRDMDSPEFVRLRKRINNEYTHYLMDYIRDEMKVPREDYAAMAERISGEYQRMREAYESAFGGLPLLYAMPMNDSEYGQNTKVGSLAKDIIYGMFQINFNRRVYSFNNRQAHPLELARCQPQPYWRVNHLLMRVWTDSGEDVTFCTGDAQFSRYWQTVEGVAEFNGESIALTSLADGSGTLRLKNSEDLLDVVASVTLEGNKLGTQELLLRWTGDGYISVKLKNNALIISETRQGATEILYVYDTDLTAGGPPHEISTPLSLMENSKRQLEVSLTGNMLSVSVSGKAVAKNIEVQVLNPGSVGIRSQTSVYITNTLRPIDNIYDGVFTQLTISDAGGETYYDGHMYGLRQAKMIMDKTVKAVVNWFIETT